MFSLTFTGILVIFLAFTQLFRPSIYLFLMLVTSIPFSATAVLHLGSQSSIAVSLFLGVLALARASLYNLLKGRLPTISSIPALLGLIFLLSLGLSLLTPLTQPGLVFRGTDPAGALEGEFSLQFGSDYLFQWSYFILWMGIIWAGVGLIDTVRQLLLLLRWVCLSSLFVCLWGWMQIGLSVIGIAYPYQIFNNTRSPGGQGYLQTIEGLTISRMSSVSVEPSVFASFVLVVAALLLGFVLLRIPLFNPGLDRGLLLFLMLSAMATTATTGYLGVGLLLFGFALMLVMLGRIRYSILIFLLVGILSVGIAGFTAYFTVPVVAEIVDGFLLNRLGSFSFAQRFISTQFALEALANHPFIGLGINSMTVYSLPFWLLANTGLLGFASFTAFYLSVFQTPLKFQKMQGEMQALALGALVALTLMGIIATLTGFPYMFGYFWLPILIAISLSKLHRRVS